MAKREVVGRYKGSVFGLLWSFLNPLLMLAVYTFAFSYVFRVSPRGAATTEWDVVDFALFAFAGMIMLGVFNEVINRAPVLIQQNQTFVKKVVFPLEILPVVQTIAALIHGAISTLLLMIAVSIMHRGITLGMLLTPLAFVPFALMTLGLAWFFTSIGVYLRDTAQTVVIFTMMLMYLSPVFYTVEMVRKRNEVLASVISFSPVTIPLQAFRAMVLGSEWPGGMAMALYTIVSVAVASAGYFFFQRTKRGFADVV